MSFQWLVPAYGHGAGRSLRGLLPLQDTFLWDPRTDRGSLEAAVSLLGTGVRHLIVPEDETLNEDLLDYGFIDSGACLEDGRRLFVLRRQAA
jgi:hypothetical protein